MSDLGPPIRVHLIRHGQTSASTAGLLSGAGSAPGASLDSIGRMQLGRLRRALAEPDWAVRVVSPLARARESLATLTDKMLQVDPRWAEANFGAWEGRSIAEVRRLWPGRWERALVDPAAAPPNGESFTEVQRRVLAAWQDLLAGSQPGQSVLVGTHLTPIRAVLAQVLQLPYSAVLAIAPAPGTKTVIDVWQDGGVRIETLGAVE